jgi:hypothetical protein
MPIGSIPASSVVSVTPNVLSAGGAGVTLSGVVLTSNSAVPMGAVSSFPDTPSVANFFGLASKQAAIAAVYFGGFSTSTMKPGKLSFWQYNSTAVAAYLRGAAGLTLAQINAITPATLTIDSDGVSETSSTITLTSDASPSAAAATIIAAFGTPSFTCAWDSVRGAFVFTTTATGNTATMAFATSTDEVAAGVSHTVTMTMATPGVISWVAHPFIAGDKVVFTTTGNLYTGLVAGVVYFVVSGGLTADAFEVAATSGGTAIATSSTESGAQTAWQVKNSCFTAAKVLTIAGAVTGTIQIGDVVSGTDGSASPNSLPANTTIVSQISGTPGGDGTYSISAAGSPADLTAFSLTSTGATGTLAKALLLTLATGAVLSQGAATTTPAASMTALTEITQNFGSFMTDFDPDGGNGNTNKLAFATWNGQQNDAYVYVCWDTDASPTTTVPATTSLGYLLAQSETSGTALIWEPSDLYYAPFLCGAIASVNFQQTNGRINFKFRSGVGLVPSVTTATVAANLDANGYNFYAEYAEGDSQWTFFGNGRISGPFNWIDSYINEAWFDSQCQIALMTLATNINSVPFNPAGAAIIESSLTGTPATATSPPTGPVTAALNFGMMNTGVPLSGTQISEVNTAAGLPIAGILQTLGYYVQAKVPPPTVRATRGPWQINIWYLDGGSVNLFNVNSTALQ